MVKARCETDSLFAGSCMKVMPLKKARLAPPRNPLPGVNAHEYPMTHQSRVTTQVIAKVCMSVASTFFLRTMPP